MTKRLKNNYGMTLVETVVAMLIFTIITSTVISLLIPTLSAYSKSNDLAEVNTIFDNLSADMLNDVSRATEVELLGGQLTVRTKTTEVYYTIDSGHLCKGVGTELRPLLPDEYYSGKTINAEYYAEDGITPLPGGTVPPAFVIKLILSNNSGVIASREYAVKPLALNQY